MSSTETVIEAPAIASHEIDTPVRESIINKLMEDDGYEQPMAEAVVDATLQFLGLIARNDLASLSPLLQIAAETTGGRLHLSPSRHVDAGWHQFIIHTRAYAEYCNRIAGRFLHHTPTEVSTGGANRPCV